MRHSLHPRHFCLASRHGFLGLKAGNDEGRDADHAFVIPEVMVSAANRRYPGSIPSPFPWAGTDLRPLLFCLIGMDPGSAQTLTRLLVRDDESAILSFVIPQTGSSASEAGYPGMTKERA